MKPTGEHIMIGVAWPYANSEGHIGHFAGTFVPADILARFHRLLGNQVVMVSGSDSHGTPVAISAEKEKLTPRQIVIKYHEKFIQTFEKLGITFDLYTTTMTENHESVVHDMFLRHRENGYIYTEVTKQLFDPVVKRFLPDRYVEGTCPNCGFTDARGDQCDNCGKTYDAVELKHPRSKVSGSKDLELRETEHFFLDLAKLNEPLIDWINDGKKANWRPHVFNYARSQIEKRDLHGRAITRDLDWGVTIPIPGYETKRLYVWYDAVIGYFSATKEWAKHQNRPDAWKSWWDKNASEKAKTYYFIGKDNTVFHAIMWPAMLEAYGGLNLPYDVPANEFLTNAGRKLSKSRGNMIPMLGLLERFQSDAWRYVLTAMAPETSDSDFTWDDFVERVNGELVANWGNLANRVLGFTAKRFDMTIPAPGAFDEKATALLAKTKAGFTSVETLYAGVKLRAALEEIRGLCQNVNQYLSEVQPWTLIKTDAAAAQTAVYVALQCVDWLKTMWSPILPESSQLIHETLGHEGQIAGVLRRKEVEDKFGHYTTLMYDANGAIGKWEAGVLKPGQKMRTPAAPFRKLEDNTADVESGQV